MQQKKTETKAKAKKIIEDVKAEANEVVADVREAATEDVATVTIDKWHVALAAVAVTAILLGIVL